MNTYLLETCRGFK